MSKPIIEIEHVSKCYRIGATKERYLSLREELAKKTRHISSAFSRAFGKAEAGSPGSETDFWALDDVSFSVQEGEAVGIIGRNGAGKSTLLKILSQITPPTKGQITMRGRVASLLEVGTGFHPELTGRENIYLNGAILGMTRGEIKRKFDEIVAFAEIEKFLDTPVKRYSSGMYVRLAFAVAAHLEPEILVIDEVLAVGDAEFQKKCLGKMGEVAKGGRTVLFVSHNMAAIQALCPNVVLLQGGRITFHGPRDEGIALYVNPEYSARTQHHGSGPVKEIWLEDAHERTIESVRCGDSLDICISYNTTTANSFLRFAIVFRDIYGQRLVCCDSELCQNGFGTAIGKNGIVKCHFDKLAFAPGMYVLDVSCIYDDSQFVIINNALAIQVISSDYFGTGKLPDAEYGAIYLGHQWTLF